MWLASSRPAKKQATGVSGIKVTRHPYETRNSKESRKPGLFTTETRSHGAIQNNKVFLRLISMIFHGEGPTDCETSDQQICDVSLYLGVCCVSVVKTFMNNSGQPVRDQSWYERRVLQAFSVEAVIDSRMITNRLTPFRLFTFRNNLVPTGTQLTKLTLFRQCFSLSFYCDGSNRAEGGLPDSKPTACCRTNRRSIDERSSVWIGRSFTL